MSSPLDQVALGIERHVAAGGWDQPPHLFALVETADLRRREPRLAERLGIPHGVLGGLTPVDQGDLPAHSDLQELLGGVGWPAEVLGTALAVERLVLPPAAERDLPRDGQAVLGWLAAHPDRQEVRIVVAVLRDGSRASALRMRAYDEEQSVLTGPDLVPGLADALAATLAD